MSLHLTAADLVVLLGPVAGLIGLWLRLTWRTRQERARRGTLVDLARALRPGYELVEHAADGTHLRITAHATLHPTPPKGPNPRNAQGPEPCMPPRPRPVR